MSTRFLDRLRLALRSFFRRRAAERELEEELAFHFQQMAAHAAARSRVAARPPRPRFGLDQVKEACRDMRTLRPLENFLTDLRFGARLLLRSPVFSIVAILSLALGIGATSAIFSLINAIILRPLPVDRPDQLQIVESREGVGEPNQRFSFPLFEAMRDLLAGQAELAAMSSAQPMQILLRRAGTSTNGVTESALVQLVSGEYFDLLRQRPQAGRLLTSEDNRTVGAHPVAVISDGYWSRMFGRAPAAVGRDIAINGAPFTIVGVTASSFFGTTVSTRNAEIWAPVMMQAAVRYAGNVSNHNGDDRKPWPSQREMSWLNIIARLPRERVPAVAEALTLGMQRDATLVKGFQEDPEARRSAQATRATLASGAGGFSSMRQNLTTPLVALLAMVGLLLAIACANIASLLLARASSRHREMAVRLSMGAGRGRLVWQLLTESLLLAFCGGALGLLIARWGSVAFMTLGNDGNAPVTGIDVTPDWRVTAFTFGVAVVTGLLFGLLPALRGTRVSLSETLKSQSRGVVGAGGRHRMLTSKLLIATQMAFSLLLLIVAALFARSLQELTRVDIGFARDRLLVARIDPHTAGYAEADLPALARRLRERLGAVPGVVGVSLSANGLFGGSRTSGRFAAEGYARGPDERLATRQEAVSEGYFETVGLRLVRGRAFGSQDFVEGRKVSVINETMARRYFRNQDPIGKRWSFADDEFEAAEAFEIVGVAADARYDDLKADSLNMVYLPTTQGPWRSLEIRTAGEPAALVADIRKVLRETESRLPVHAIETLDSRVARSLRPEQLIAGLVTAFSSVALFLACLGLYGTISYAVSRRTAELGVRMALGADRGAVLWLIMKEALVLVLTGLVVGIPLAYLAARAMTSLFYAVPPSDPFAHVAAAGVLVAIAALAAYLPARRASRVDPMLALRAE